MKRIVVEIGWDHPDVRDWLAPDNVALALHAYCPNTRFSVRAVEAATRPPPGTYRVTMESPGVLRIVDGPHEGVRVTVPEPTDPTAPPVEAEPLATRHDLAVAMVRSTVSDFEVMEALLAAMSVRSPGSSLKIRWTAMSRADARALIEVPSGPPGASVRAPKTKKPRTKKAGR